MQTLVASSSLQDSFIQQTHTVPVTQYNSISVSKTKIKFGHCMTLKGNMKSGSAANFSH